MKNENQENTISPLPLQPSSYAPLGYVYADEQEDVWREVDYMERMRLKLLIDEGPSE